MNLVLKMKMGNLHGLRLKMPDPLPTEDQPWGGDQAIQGLYRTERLLREQSERPHSRDSHFLVFSQERTRTSTS